MFYQASASTRKCPWELGLLAHFLVIEFKWRSEAKPQLLAIYWIYEKKKNNNNKAFLSHFS